jgi:pilus assembly protein CpaB
MSTVQVIVVDTRIPRGTPAAQLGSSVRTELLPATAAVPGRVRSLTALAGKVATVDLMPGEQLLASRFSAAGNLRAPGTVAVPSGDQEVSVLLDPQRTVGGRLAAGDKVGIYLSQTLSDGTVQTSAVLHHVLVTQVQGGVTSSAPSSGKDAGTQKTASTGTPTQGLMVTLAVTAQQAEPVVFGMEHGSLWLSLEPADADTGKTTVLDQTNVYTEAHP